MLRITEQRTNGRFVLRLEGRFSGDWVREVDACWHAAVDAGHTRICVDLTDVYTLDAGGQALLARMHRAGVCFLTRGCAIPELVREISEL